MVGLPTFQLRGMSTTRSALKSGAGKSKKKVRFFLAPDLLYLGNNGLDTDIAKHMIELPATYSWMLARTFTKKVMKRPGARVSQQAVREAALDGEPTDAALLERLRELNLRVIAGAEEDTYECVWRHKLPLAPASIKPRLDSIEEE